MPIIHNIVRELINPSILLLMGAATVVFLWGIFEYIRDASAGKKEDGQRHMIWGIVGLAIMVGVFGIMNLVKGTVDDLTGNSPQGEIDPNQPFPEF